MTDLPAPLPIPLPGWPNPGDASWRAEARCRGRGPEDFFPDATGDTKRGPNRRAYAVPVAVCDLCPVRSECLSYAEEMGITDGMWGGQSPDQRHARLVLRERAAERARQAGWEAHVQAHLDAGAEPTFPELERDATCG